MLLLEDSGIITKTVDEQHKSKQVYKLTQKGIDLLPVLTEVIVWSTKYDKYTASDMKFVSRVKRDREGLLKEITTKLKSESKEK